MRAGDDERMINYEWSNFSLNYFENIFNEVTLAIKFKDILNVSYPPSSIKVIFSECFV